MHLFWVFFFLISFFSFCNLQLLFEFARTAMPLRNQIRYQILTYVIMIWVRFWNYSPIWFQVSYLVHSENQTIGLILYIPSSQKSITKTKLGNEIRSSIENISQTMYFSSLLHKVIISRIAWRVDKETSLLCSLYRGNALCCVHMLVNEGQINLQYIL